MPEKNAVRPKNLDSIKAELDWALSDTQGAPSYLIVEIVLKTLDNAQREGRINQRERVAACNYIKSEYGYDF